MPFIALSKSTKSRIDITNYENPKDALKAEDICCQLCEQPMLIRDGPIIRAHFAHRSNCTNTEYSYHPESVHHDLGKRWIADQIRSELWKYTHATIELEVPIKEIRRVADVLVTCSNGWRIAHECQLVDLGEEELKQRTEDYLSVGIDVFWWLGKKATNHVKWVYEHFGYILTIEFPKG